jgi:hypothetical protein
MAEETKVHRDIVVSPTVILTTVVATAIWTIVTMAAVFLASTGIVTVIPMVVIAEQAGEAEVQEEAVEVEAKKKKE